ncbi:MAG: hypothetical protein EP329_03035 [Deltaproteobacteria bacterium]|nr:MAG: hypothetical protein EP329_03035 [Deltaproteobacteria bacterium]
MSAHVKAIDLSDAQVPAGSIWKKLPLVFAVLGIAGLALAFVTAGEDHKQFWYSYLTSFMFWLSLGLGSLFFVIIHHATRAGWSTVVRRIAENYMITLPVIGLLALPIVFGGMDDLYHVWVHPGETDLFVQAKTGFLNTDFFTIRVIGYIAIWTLFAGFFYVSSVKQDTSGDPRLAHRMRRIAPVALILFALTITFAAIDFMMSLDPHWYSTIFGVVYFGGSAMMTYAILALTSMGLQKGGILKNAITTEHYHDFGKMAFGFMVFWSYTAFSQFMLIWYANIPEETIWYYYRSTGGWEVIAALLFILHFVVPFFFLMSRHIKRRNLTLAVGAIILLVAHYLDMLWLIQPTMHQHGEPHFAMHIADILAFVGIGGVVLAVFSWRLGAAAAAPMKDPRLAESLEFENF